MSADRLSEDRIDKSWRVRQKEETMMVSVVCLLILFLNSTLGDDLVVVSSSKSKCQTSRWKRGAELAPKHWIEIQADIRSRYLKFFTKDADKF